MKTSKRLYQALSRASFLGPRLSTPRHLHSLSSSQRLGVPSRISTPRSLAHNHPISISSARFNSTTSNPQSSTSSPSVPAVEGEEEESSPFSQLPREQQAAYEITFTCKPCTTRSTHRISKQGYHHGTVLITCQNCKNRHVIADHLRIFSDKRVTLEDILREKGAMLKKGHLGFGGDIEFWDDGSETRRSQSGIQDKSANPKT